MTHPGVDKADLAGLADIAGPAVDLAIGLVKALVADNDARIINILGEGPREASTAAGMLALHMLKFAIIDLAPNMEAAALAFHRAIEQARETAPLLAASLHVESL